MTILFIDSFDYYDTAALAYKYDSVFLSSIVSPGRNSSNGALNITSIGQVAKTFNTMRDRIVVGFAMRGVPAGGGIFKLSRLGQLQFYMTTDVFGNVEFRNGNTSVSSLIGTLPGGIIETTWNYYELKIYIDNSGTIEFRKNGEDLTGYIIPGPASPITWASTIVGNVAEWNSFAFISSISGSHYFDDFYIIDPDTGTAPQNNFLGDILITAIKPDGPSTAGGGYPAQWTPSTPVTANYLKVNEDPPDGDTTYNFSNTPGATDIYAFEDLTLSSGTIFGLQTNIVARKAGGGTKIIQDQVRVGSTNYTGTKDHYLALEYSSFETFHEKNPSTGLAWTAAEINAAEFGLKLNGFLAVISGGFGLTGESITIPYPHGLAIAYDSSPSEITSSHIGGYLFNHGSAIVVVTYN